MNRREVFICAISFVAGSLVTIFIYAIIIILIK